MADDAITRCGIGSLVSPLYICDTPSVEEFEFQLSHIQIFYKINVIDPYKIYENRNERNLMDNGITAGILTKEKYILLNPTRHLNLPQYFN